MNIFSTPRPLALCLCGTLLLAASPAGATPGLPQAQAGVGQLIQAQLVALSQASEVPTLTLEDLPEGFTEIPPMVREQLTLQLQALSQQFGTPDLDPDNFFVFVNPANFQVVMGFTGSLPSPSEQEGFDANLTGLQEPEMQQQLVAQMQSKLEKFGAVEITNYTSIPELNDFADASTGMTLDLKLQGQQFKIDMASFRRSSVGAFTAVMYPQAGQAIAVKTIADKLDRRILEES